MAFKIKLERLAQLEIEEAYYYYSEKSNLAVNKFRSSLNKAYKSLSINPYYQKRHEDIRSFKLYGFPYKFYYLVNEDTNSIEILSLFHTSRKPQHFD